MEPNERIPRVLLYMRLGHIEMFCKDCFATQAFYMDILKWETVDVQGGQFVWLRSEDGLEFLLRPGKKFACPESYDRSADAVVVYVEDLDDFADRLKRALINFNGSENDPDSLTFQDPDGRWLQAVEHP